MRYEKIEINGKESLPQTNGRYDCVFSDNTFGQASYDKSGISASQSDIWWINKVKFYYEPLPQTEISDMVVGIVCRYWKFDSEQQHLSSWHDKQDCIVELRSQLSRIEPEKESDPKMKDGSYMKFSCFDLDNDLWANVNCANHIDPATCSRETSCTKCEKYKPEQPVSEPESISEFQLNNIRNNAISVLELTKGFTPEQRGYNSKQTVEEIKILEISPSGNWVKTQNMNGNKYWKHSSDIVPMEVLASLETKPSN
jgi:hypothetical protein